MFKKLSGKFSSFAVLVKKRTAVILAASFLVTTCCNFTFATSNVVTIADSDCAPIEIKTSDTNVGKILSKQGIVLGEKDTMNYSLSDNVGDDAVIEIYRIKDIKVVYMGQTKEMQTTKSTVGNVLTEMGITVDAKDNVTPGVNSKVKDGDVIEVVLYDEHNVTVQEETAYNTVERENLDLASGERVVVQEGKNGVIEYEYTIHCENGVEVSRELVRETRLSEPVEEIVEYGPEQEWELGVVPASAPTKYNRVEVFKATAYDASPMDNGIWAGQTSTGMPLVYGVIAVDPRVIPYGTKMYIESVDGQYKYGYAIAGDCGGAIKGKKVDLFFESRSTCYQFGRRDVRIYFLD